MFFSVLQTDKTSSEVVIEELSSPKTGPSARVKTHQSSFISEYTSAQRPEMNHANYFEVSKERPFTTEGTKSKENIKQVLRILIKTKTISSASKN